MKYFDTITVLVGPDATRYTVHKDLICSKSPYFEKGTSGEWPSAQTQTVTLSDTKPDIFEAYMHWVYTSDVNMDLIEDPPGTAPGPPPSYRSLAALWMFADMVLDPELCNRLLDMTLAKSIATETFAAPSTLTFIWDHTSTDSPLRTLHVDMLTSLMNGEGFEKRKPELPHELIVELAARYIKGERLDRIKASSPRRTSVFT